jgi:agmatinase
LDFDPNSAAEEGSGIFGLPFTEAQAKLVYVPVPWEPTTSYGAGASKAPAAILEASRQVDLYDFDVEKPYEPGLFMRPVDRKVAAWNKQALGAPVKKVNELSDKLNAWVAAQTASVFAKGKIPAIIGGDHSVPYGAIKTASHRHPGLGLLHFDAHHDLRPAYEGYQHSHASIFHNVLTDMPEVERLVQIGIRDFSEQEAAFAKSQGGRVKVYYDAQIAEHKFDGKPFKKLAAQIAADLPQKVWITFDIDGLDPRLCPGTGTPVPGGLDFNEVNAILKSVALSGREIVGFDLVEVSPSPKSEWDANVGARLLYKMSAWTLASLGLAKPRG